MEIEGKVIALLPIQSGVSKNGNPWKSQGVVIEEVKDQYPQSVCVDLFGEDKISEADLKVGDLVKVQFNISCRQFGTKWYNSLRAWRISKEGGNNEPTNKGAANFGQSTNAPTPDSNNLPF